jgi:hypothetical protein
MNRELFKLHVTQNTFTKTPLNNLPRQNYDKLVNRILTKRQ